MPAAEPGVTFKEIDINYQGFKDNIDYSGIDLLQMPKLKWLWLNEFFDGPLQGIVEVEGKLGICCFVEESDNESEQGWYRKFVVLELSDEQIKAEQYWHNEFVKYVGDHFKCNPDSSRITVGAQKPKSEWDKFYVPYKEKYQPNFESNKVLGWTKI
ncbi:hypothetical protein [Litoribacillus peritrichatus]|uniref:Uncharacterized protein n=1 Tax=Litoribacillus peritrichatus TaxID=718191 RepID=A0ABP7M6Y1_9GAMM